MARSHPEDLELEGERVAAPTRRLDRLAVGADVVVGVTLILEMLAVFVSIVTRFVFNTPFLGTEETGALALTILAFIGGATAYRRGQHMAVDVLADRLPAGARVALRSVRHWLVIGFCGIVLWFSIPVLLHASGSSTPMLGLNNALLDLPLVVGMLLMMAFAGERLLAEPHRPALITGAVMTGLTVAVALSQDYWTPYFTDRVPMVLALAMFVLLVMAGVPVGFVLGLAALAYFFTSGSQPLETLPLTLESGATPFVLLALPFFIFAGLVMDRGGIGVRLVGFIGNLIGHFRGGLLQVLIVSMYLVSGLSGSKSADVAAVGLPMYQQLKRNGYDEGETVAVLASAGAMGETVPPSIAILVLGSVTTLSIGSLFLAGLLPAAAIAVCLMVVVYARARRSGLKPMARPSPRVLASSGLRAVLPLLMPVVLFGGILTGAGTPTEVSSLAVIYGLLLAIVVYRELGLRETWRVTADAAALSGMILFIIAAAATFSRALTLADLPITLSQGMATLPPWVFMLVTVALLLVMGSLLEGIAALLIFAPLLVPVASHVGVNPLHYGIVMVIAMGIGSFAPPVGIGLYVACAVCRTPLKKAMRPMWLYVAVLVIGLLLVAFVPWLTLAVPHALRLSTK